MKAQTITEGYRLIQQELHQNLTYGLASLAFAPLVADLIRQANVRSVSDYGVGKKNLLKGLAEAGIEGIAYSP